MIVLLVLWSYCYCSASNLFSCWLFWSLSSGCSCSCCWYVKSILPWILLATRRWLLLACKWQLVTSSAILWGCLLFCREGWGLGCVWHCCGGRGWWPACPQFWPCSLLRPLSLPPIIRSCVLLGHIMHVHWWSVHCTQQPPSIIIMLTAVDHEQPSLSKSCRHTFSKTGFPFTGSNCSKSPNMFLIPNQPSPPTILPVSSACMLGSDWTP